MAQFGDLISYLADREQQRGIAAVLDALRQIGVVRYNPAQACFHFKAISVASETLQVAIDRNLQQSC
jgi:hypothetical protein